MKPYWKQYGGPGYEVLERAEQAIARYKMLDPGDTVVIGVSGGPDSTCLLDVLARLGEKLDLTLVVAHVDHGLSEESEKIGARVSSTAATAGFEVHLARAPELEGSNLHARARDFRYEFFEIVALREEANKIATGHTLDDRVETTLARLLHGAGTAGLAGLPPADRKRIRPLISSRRGETRAYCEEVGLEFTDDPANSDVRFERPAIRSRIVSVIEEHWGDGAVRSIARSAERLGEDAQALAAVAGQLYSDNVRTEAGGVSLDRALLELMPRSLRRRVLEQAVGRVRDRAGGIDAALDALDAPDPSGSVRFSVASGIEISLDGDKVRVSRLGDDPDREES